jgi:hypothetical protein
MSKPYLFLDVDGVLNRISQSGGDWDDFEKHYLKPFNRGTFCLHLSKTMCAALAELSVDIVWLTTWCEEAASLVAPCVGWPEFPVAGFGSDLTGKKVSKIGCLEIYMEENGVRPFIWIDDDAIPYYASDDFDQQGWPHLLIRPNQYKGIEKHQIELIETFLKELEDVGLQ